MKLIKSDLYTKTLAGLTSELKQADLDSLLNNNQTTNDKNLLSFFLSNLFSIFCLNIKTKQANHVLLIDVYNVLSINSIAYLYSQSMIPEKDPLLLKVLDGDFWKRSAYIIGQHQHAFSLDDIEHGIIRGFNKNSP